MVEHLVAADDSADSIAHGSHTSSSLLMHVSPVASCGGYPPSVPLLLGPQGILLPPIAAAPPRWPDPDGLVGPPVLMGRACTVYERGQFSCDPFPGLYHGGSIHGPLHGGSLQAVPPGHCFRSSASTAKYWQSFNFPGGVRAPVPSILFCGGHSCPSSHLNHPHAHSSLASTLASEASLLRPFVNEDSSSASDVSMSFWNTLSAEVAADNMGGSFSPDAPVPQNTGSVPLVVMGGGLSPPVVSVTGDVQARIPGKATPHVPLERMVPP